MGGVLGKTLRKLKMKNFCGRRSVGYPLCRRSKNGAPGGRKTISKNADPMGAPRRAFDDRRPSDSRGDGARCGFDARLIVGNEIDADGCANEPTSQRASEPTTNDQRPTNPWPWVRFGRGHKGTNLSVFYIPSRNESSRKKKIYIEKLCKTRRGLFLYTHVRILCTLTRIPNPLSLAVYLFSLPSCKTTRIHNAFTYCVSATHKQ